MPPRTLKSPRSSTNGTFWNPLHQMLQQTFARQLLPGDEVKIGLLELFFWNDLLQQGSGGGYEVWVRAPPRVCRVLRDGPPHYPDGAIVSRKEGLPKMGTDGVACETAAGSALLLGRIPGHRRDFQRRSCSAR